MRQDVRLVRRDTRDGKQETGVETYEMRHKRWKKQDMGMVVKLGETRCKRQEIRDGSGGGTGGSKGHCQRIRALVVVLAVLFNIVRC
jgi:hypothetical protein